MEKLDNNNLKDFLKYKCDLYLKQPLTPPQCKIIVAYCTANHILEIETRWWLTIILSLEITKRAMVRRVEGHWCTCNSDMDFGSVLFM